eukprot:4749121-Prymnesium_polylepis.1
MAPTWTSCASSSRHGRLCASSSRLYAEWKTEWPRQVDEAMEHSRALAFLRRAMAWAKAMAA